MRAVPRPPGVPSLHVSPEGQSASVLHSLVVVVEHTRTGLRIEPWSNALPGNAPAGGSVGYCTHLAEFGEVVIAADGVGVPDVAISAVIGVWPVSRPITSLVGLGTTRSPIT